MDSAGAIDGDRTRCFSRDRRVCNPIHFESAIVVTQYRQQRAFVPICLATYVC